MTIKNKNMLNNSIEAYTGKNLDLCTYCKCKNIVKIGVIPENFHFGTIQYMHPINKSNLYKCANCELYFKNPCIDSKIINYLYTKQPSLTWEYTDINKRSDLIFLKDFIIQKLNLQPNDNILDYGCFDGFFLSELKPQLKNCNYFGIEPSEEAVDKATSKGINILGGDENGLNDFNDFFDLIVMIDVFEHLTNITSVFEQLSKSLKRGGKLVIITGSTDSLPFKKYLNNYHYVTMPEHLVFISKNFSKHLSQSFSFVFKEYILISHDNKNNSFILKTKKFIKNKFKLFLNLFSINYFPLQFQVFYKILKFRGRGTLDINNLPDHAFILFEKK